MKPESNKIASFLSCYGITDFTITKVADDCSFRSYYRIFSSGKTYILMFAPLGYEDPRPFINIANFLCQHGFLAPQIFASDLMNGFLLLEDFGDTSFNKALQQNPASESLLYLNACEVLLKLQQISTKPDILHYNSACLLKEVMLFIDWYLPYKNYYPNSTEKSNYIKQWLYLFDYLNKDNQCLVLRDYHADNLMLLHKNEVGLLDFQDALIGSPAYDLVSLLEDVRRDVSVAVQEQMLELFLHKSGYDTNKFVQDYQILSLQRNIKILGIFARKAIRDNKKEYLSFLPRTEKLVLNRLQQSKFANMQWFNNFITPFIIQD
jgi:hypothetical protein